MVGLPDDAKDKPPAGPEALEQGTRPASPVSSQDTEGPFGYHVPSFQWSPRELSGSVDSRSGDFESPITK